MKALLKSLGLLFVLAGVIVLVYSEFSKLESNSLLILSGVLIVIGLAAYILLNSILES